MNEETRNKLLLNVNYVANGEEKIFEGFDFESIIMKYSNTKKPIFKFKINEKIISRNNKYIVSYDCLFCKKEIIISLNGLVKKVNNNIIQCRVCKESNIAKREKQSLFMVKSNPKRIEKKSQPDIPIETCKDVIVKSNAEFDKCDKVFTEEYYKRNLTLQEFELIKSKIISVQNDKFKNLESFIYYPHIKCNNQTKFIPKLYDVHRDIFEDLIYVRFECEKCNNTFINKDIRIQKKRHKIYCRECIFCNDTFKIRHSKNINDEIIKYQSRLELRFISFCNENKILVRNGPTIEYLHNNKKKKYFVDFFLPDVNCMIEMKDAHIWHKKQIESGMWEAKINAVNELIKQKKYNSFMMISSKNFTNIVEKILDKI